jgi:hypothetical protein
MKTAFLTSVARGMLQVSRCILLVSIVPIATAHPLLLAQTAAPEGDGRAFDLASDPAFRDYKHVLTEFAHKHRPKAENDFCISAFYTRDDRKSAWVIWRQGRQMILWEGQPDLDDSRRDLHLASDVVPTEDDLHGSTYRVTKAWVERMTAACEQSGVKVHVPRALTSSRRSPEEVSK